MSKNILTMNRQGEVIQLRIVDNDSHKVLESYEFHPNKDVDNDTFFEICEKLGFDFQKYHKRKNIVWQ